MQRVLARREAAGVQRLASPAPELLCSLFTGLWVQGPSLSSFHRGAMQAVATPWPIFVSVVVIIALFVGGVKSSRGMKSTEGRAAGT